MYEALGGPGQYFKIRIYNDPNSIERLWISYRKPPIPDKGWLTVLSLNTLKRK